MFAKMRPDFSIICCVSKPQVFEECLLDSINKCRGKHNIEIIPVLNNDNRYSASNALNIGIDTCRSDNIIIAHQDVRLLGDWFTTLQGLLDTISDDWGVIGTAGIALKYGSRDIGRWGGALVVDTVAVGSVWDNDLYDKMPPYWDGTKDLVPAHCADECLIIVNRQTGLRFDPMYRGFHFYGVDMCLQARSAAYKVYCAHLPIVHYGKYSASMQGSSGYWSYLRYLHSKWCLRFPELFGTHMHWTAEGLVSYIPLGLESHDGITIDLKAMGIGKVVLSTDRQQGLQVLDKKYVYD
jgi:hypothetical protein